MCLDVINKTKPRSIGKGYKVFRTRDGELYPLYVKSKGYYPLQRWIKVSDHEIVSTEYCRDISGYQPGFHIYVDKKNAKAVVDKFLGWGKNICVKRVEYRGAYVSGRTFDWVTGLKARTIVANEMRIQ